MKSFQPRDHAGYLIHWTVLVSSCVIGATWTQGGKSKQCLIASHASFNGARRLYLSSVVFRPANS